MKLSKLQILEIHDEISDIEQEMEYLDPDNWHDYEQLMIKYNRLDFLEWQLQTGLEVALKEEKRKHLKLVH